MALLFTPFIQHLFISGAAEMLQLPVDLNFIITATSFFIFDRCELKSKRGSNQEDWIDITGE